MTLKLFYYELSDNKLKDILQGALNDLSNDDGTLLHLAAKVW